MNAEEILNLITNIGPAVSSIATIILSMVITIKRCKSLNSQQLLEMQSLTNSVVAKTSNVQEENYILKKELNQLLADNAEIKAELKKINSRVREPEGAKDANK